ncbi:MAG: DUF2975 domain-containing protein [Clostridia bacterium]|nr:DUF2975 domain-containing protein [Clostridia bacterium]
MFKNPGRIIRYAAVVTAFLIVLACVIIVLATDMEAGVSVALILGGIVGGLVIALFLDAFGALVESNERIEENTARIENIEEALKNLKLDITLTEDDEDDA